MEVRLASLVDGAASAVGTVVIIDVFRAFTAAALAFARGARRIVMVDDLDRALALRAAGVGDYCIGERHGAKPAGFDFGNSPAELAAAALDGKTLIQTTSNGTAGINAARGAERIFAGAFVTAEATVQAILRAAPPVVTLVAMGSVNRGRADEDELCALYLRSRLQGRAPDRTALAQLAASLVPPINSALAASGDYDPRDRSLALQIDLVPFAIAVRREADLLIAEPHADA
ncbi:MAG TPA: 2-phosphosulfolactate phosphatase [Candidatus Sulfotelmatobacter sp.]|nr:2-phosphosulfolactate phosphatase [Candidatus Sulfotelmatobacter sp.]